MHDDPMNDFPNSTTTAGRTAPARVFSSIIRPTPSELAHGRLMRAPDHEGGEEGSTILGTAENNEDTDEQKAAAAEETRRAALSDEERTEEDRRAALTDEQRAAEDAARDKGEQNEFLGAPEGDYTISGLPDGVTVDAEVLGALSPVAKEIGLSDVAMSKLAGVYNEKILPHLQSRVQQDIDSQTMALGKEWDAEARLEIEGGKDKDGKAIEPAKGEDGQPVYDGKSFAEVRQAAAKALDRFAGPELREFLETSKLGNHPALVRAFYRIGRAIKEDGFERGGTEQAPKSRVQKYYGDRATT